MARAITRLASASDKRSACIDAGAPSGSTDDAAQPVKATESPSGPNTANSQTLRLAGATRQRDRRIRDAFHHQLSTSLVTVSGLKGF